MEAANNLGVKRSRGRPPSKNWEAERPIIEMLIRAGMGIPAIAKHYEISISGARVVLKRLGLQTLWQEQDSAS